MSSPGQKRSKCGHVIASFDGHFKCARCRDKGVGEDACVLKKDCTVCKELTPEQILQLATPTYRECKSKEKKLVSSPPATTLVDPSNVSVLGKVEGARLYNLKPHHLRRRNAVNHPSPLLTRINPALVADLQQTT